MPDIRLSIGTVLLIFIAAFASHAQIVNRVTIQGEVSHITELQPYTLDIIYEPMTTKGAQKRWRQIKSISLVLVSNQIKIPKSAYEDLKFTHEPTTLRINATTGDRYFEIDGGDGELFYKVVFYVNDNQLVRRELFRNMGPKPEVLSFSKSE
jgi:hypothetical protein